MRGLLRKDLYMAAKYCRMFLLVAVVFLAVSLFGGGSLFFTYYPCIFCGLVPATLFTYDERERWDQYAGTLPYTRAQLVSVKYLLGLLIGAAVLLLTAVVQAVQMLRTGCFDPAQYFGLLAALLGVSLLGSGIILPFLFRFGAVKGRIAYYVVLIVLCAGIAALSGLSVEGVSFGGGSAQVLFCAAAAGCYLLSWRISVRCYQKREL